MHMADALLSPQVGAVMWGATAVTTVYCAKKVRERADDGIAPLMGVTGAFVFAAQMLNFSIPGTGSSGHLGGGLLLAVMLGPHAAFLVMASILAVQALFFADGGLLALGANVFNLGFFPAMLAYPLVYRRLAGDGSSPARLLVGGVLAAIVGLQLGSLGVVLQTTLSGVSELPFGAFAALMQPIHLAIGLVEGLVTVGLVAFIRRAQPEMLVADYGSVQSTPRRGVLVALLVSALVCAGLIAWFASPDLDGLEWSIERVVGGGELTNDSAVHESLAEVQEKTSVMPDYSAGDPGEATAEGEQQWPAVDSGTSVAGVTGTAIVLGVSAIAGLMLRRRSKRGRRSTEAP